MANTNTPSTPASINDPKDSTFPKSGLGAPSSSSPGTPSAGGSGTRPISEAADAADDAVDALAAAERDVMRRVVQGAHEAIDRIADKAIPAVERLKGSYSDATESLKHRADQAMDLKDEWTESLRLTVREHPLAAIATALAVGAVIARITANNDR